MRKLRPKVSCSPRIANTNGVAEANAVIEGMNYQWAPVENTPLKYLSMAGGASVYLKGRKMSPAPANNQILMRPMWSDDLPDLFAPSLSGKQPNPVSLPVDSDEYDSNTELGVLAYTMPSVADLMMQPLEAFDGDALPQGLDSSKLEFELKVLNTETDEVLTGMSH